MCVHVCVCVLYLSSVLYLSCYSIQGLSCTNGPVSVSIFVQFFFQLLYILHHYHNFLQSIPSIYTFVGKTVHFCTLQANFFLQSFIVPSLKYLASPFLLSSRSFLFVSYRFFINLYTLIKFFLFLLSFNVVRCI